MAVKDYYELLEVAPTATAAEIKKAFREQIAKYHPDKVQHLGKEFQAMAAERVASVAKLRQAHEQLAGKLAPMADDAAFTLTLGIQGAADKGDIEEIKKTLGELADNRVHAVQRLQRVEEH